MQAIASRLRLSHDHLVLQSELIERTRSGRAGLSRKTIQRMSRISSEDLDRIALGQNVRGAPDALSISRAARLVAEIERNSQLSGLGMADWYRPLAASMQLDYAAQLAGLQRFTGLHKCYSLTPDNRQLFVSCVSIDRNREGQPRFRHYERILDTNNQLASSAVQLCHDGHVFFIGQGMLFVSIAAGSICQVTLKPSSGDHLSCKGMLFNVTLPGWVASASRVCFEHISTDPLPELPVDELGLFDSDEERYTDVINKLGSRTEQSTLAAID